jgi:hypothetical protein
MIVNCHKKNCPSSINIAGPLSSNFKYTCRNHTAVDDNDVHFQDCQFDRQIGSGTDPKAYERGIGFSGTRGVRPVNSSINGNTEKTRLLSYPRGSSVRFRKRLIERAGKELAGHKNADKILKILREDIRDSNSGVNDVSE